MRWGFTGSRYFVPTQESLIRFALWIDERDDTPSEFVTGGAVGFDHHIGLYLTEMYPGARHTIIVPANRSKVKNWWKDLDYSEIPVEVIEMPHGTSYRERDQAIVNHSDALLSAAAFAEDDPRSIRSGTWMTVRLARAKGIPIGNMTKGFEHWSGEWGTGPYWNDENGEIIADDFQANHDKTFWDGHNDMYETWSRA